MIKRHIYKFKPLQELIIFWTHYNIWMPKRPYSLKWMFGSFLKKTSFHKLQLQQMNTCSSFCFLFFCWIWEKKKRVIIPQWRTLHFLIKKYISAAFHHTGPATLSFLRKALLWRRQSSSSWSSMEKGHKWSWKRKWSLFPETLGVQEEAQFKGCSSH